MADSAYAVLKMMASGEHPAVLFDYSLAGGVAEVLAADGALPVFGVALLGAGDGLRLMMLHGVARRNHPTILCDYICALSIREILLASRAIPIGAVASLRAGGFVRLMFHQFNRMGRRINLCFAPLDLFLKVLIIEISRKGGLLIAACCTSSIDSRHFAVHLCCQRFRLRAVFAL